MFKSFKSLKLCLQYYSVLARREILQNLHIYDAAIRQPIVLSKNLLGPHRYCTVKDPAFKDSEKNYQERLSKLVANHRLAPKQRIQLLEETWKELTNSLTLLEEEHFIKKLECYLKCRAEVVPKSFMNTVKGAGLELSQDLLKVLLRVVAEHGDPGYVSSVVTSMKSRNYQADDSVFAALVVAHAARGDMAAARQVLTTMEECSVRPGADTFTALMRAAAMAGDYAGLHTHRTQAEQAGVVLTSQQILKVVETVVMSRKEHLIPSLKNMLDVCSADEIFQLVESLVYSGYPAAGYAVLKMLKNNGDLAIYVDFISVMLAAKSSPSQLISVAKSMVVDGTYDRALYDVTKVLLQQTRVEDGAAALRECKAANIPVRPHFFWPLILAAYQNDGENGIYSSLELMKELEVAPDTETLGLVLSRLTSDDGDAVLRRVQAACGAPLSAILTPYLSHLVQMGQLNQALQLGQKYESSLKEDMLDSLMSGLVVGYRTTKDYKTVGKILELIGVGNITLWLENVISNRFHWNVDDLEALLKELKKVGCFISEGDDNLLLRYLIRSKITANENIAVALRSLVQYDETTTVAADVQKLTPLQDLECHLRELEGKGMNTRGVLRKLVQESCRAGDVKGARKAYKKLLDTGAGLSAGIVAAMMQVNVQDKQLDDSLEFCRKLTEDYPSFNIDAYKIIDLATLLVNNGKFNEALELLKTNRQGGIFQRSFKQWERNCWELLTATEESEGADGVQNMFATLLANNFCLPSNVMLGPLVRVHLKSGNIEAAVKEYTRCAQKYKKTPLQQELMTAVVSSSNIELLEPMLNASQAVHGTESAQAVLVAALALKGEVGLLSNVFKESKNKLANKKMLNQITRMADLGQIEALKTIIEADSQSDLVDTVITSTLQYYHKKGKTEEALEWASQLDQKGIQLTASHRKSIANLVASAAKI